MSGQARPARQRVAIARCRKINVTLRKYDEFFYHGRAVPCGAQRSGATRARRRAAHASRLVSLARLCVYFSRAIAPGVHCAGAHVSRDRKIDVGLRASTALWLLIRIIDTCPVDAAAILTPVSVVDIVVVVV